MTEYRLVIQDGNQEVYDYYSNKKEALARAKALAEMDMEVTVEKITVDSVTGMEEVDCIAAY